MTADTMAAGAPMTGRILDAAQRAIERLGYNGLSFREIAATVGIKSSSVHYHFPTKGDLGAAVARRYTDLLVAALDRHQADPAVAIETYVGLIRTQLHDGGRMCLCGMLAAEIDALPDEVQSEVRRFVGANVDWLSATFASQNGGDPEAFRARASAVFAALEGAMLIARGSGDIARFDAIVTEYQRTGLI